MITQIELKKILSYDKETGLFAWKSNPSPFSRVKIGGIAGCYHKEGYIVIGINNKSYNAHRLAWLYTYGSFPPEQIDHINHNRSDNRLENLRSVTNQENAMNRSKHKLNKSGVTGVSWSKSYKRWIGNITIDGKRIYLGNFVSFSDAVDARKNAEVLYGFHENHGKETHGCM